MPECIKCGGERFVCQSCGGSGSARATEEDPLDIGGFVRSFLPGGTYCIECQGKGTICPACDG